VGAGAGRSTDLVGGGGGGGGGSGGGFDHLAADDNDITAGGDSGVLDEVGRRVYVGVRGRPGAHERQRRDHGGQTTVRR